MKRAVGVLLLAVLLTACGGSAPAAGGGGAGAGAATGDIPPLSVAWFGTAVASDFGIVGKLTSVKQGSPVFVVGHLFPAHDPSEVTVNISIGGSIVKSVTLLPGAGGSNDVVSADLSGSGLGPGTYIVSFVTGGRTILATGNLGVTP
jgi:hypothetical protein